MSEEKTNNQETADETPVTPATDDTQNEGAAGEIFSFRDDKSNDKVVRVVHGQAEELPESVKKILEKRKEKAEGKGAKKKGKKKKVEKKVSIGKAFIKATYNNTIITLADNTGNVISWASAGVAGFKGPKKSTPYAASIITRIAVERAKEYGLEEVGVYVKGVGTGRESAIRALNASGLTVSYIRDITPIPHNGCRAKKPRRV
jgi:small subunit ribosomal protein S11